MNAPAAAAARRMNLYALVLIVLGLIGYGLAWSESKAPPSPTPAQAEAEAAVDGSVESAPVTAPSLTPLIFTIGPALLMLLMGFMTTKIDRDRLCGGRLGPLHQVAGRREALRERAALRSHGARERDRGDDDPEGTPLEGGTRRLIRTLAPSRRRSPLPVRAG
jgi:hypothetical protein